jgi:hypothetical protein
MNAPEMSRIRPGSRLLGAAVRRKCARRLRSEAGYIDWTVLPADERFFSKAGSCGDRWMLLSRHYLEGRSAPLVGALLPLHYVSSLDRQPLRDTGLVSACLRKLGRAVAHDLSHVAHRSADSLR